MNRSTSPAPASPFLTKNMCWSLPCYWCDQYSFNRWTQHQCIEHWRCCNFYIITVLAKRFDSWCWGCCPRCCDGNGNARSNCMCCSKKSRTSNNTHTRIALQACNAGDVWVRCHHQLYASRHAGWSMSRWRPIAIVGKSSSIVRFRYGTWHCVQPRQHPLHSKSSSVWM